MSYVAAFSARALGLWRSEPERRPRRLLGLALLVAVGGLLAVSLPQSRAAGMSHAAIQHSVRTGSIVAVPKIATRRPLCRPGRDGTPAPGACGDPWRRAIAPNPAARIMAPPSTSVAAIQGAFQAVGSPLADSGPRRDGRTYAEYLWDEGRRTGVDPAVVMAFFDQESTYGTRGMATETHDLANERPVAGRPFRCGYDGCYVYDDNWFDGIDRIYGLLAAYARQGLTTADQVIPTWAPSSDLNDDTLFSSGIRNTMRALSAVNS